MNTNRAFRGFIASVPPTDGRPTSLDAYHFSGFELSTQKHFRALFRVLELPGYVSPAEFAMDVSRQAPLVSDFELFSPDFKLGRFSYIRVSSGEEFIGSASELAPIDGEMEEDASPGPAIDRDVDQDKPTEREPDFPTPGLDF